MTRRFFLKLFSLLPFVPKVAASPDYVKGMTFSFKSSAVNTGGELFPSSPVSIGDLTEASLEQAIMQIEKFKQDREVVLSIKPTKE